MQTIQTDGRANRHIERPRQTANVKGNFEIENKYEMVNSERESESNGKIYGIER